MKAELDILITILALVFADTHVFAHTEQEYIDKGRRMVGISGSVYFDNEDDLDAAAESNDPLYQWDNLSQDGFFGYFATNGWTRADCELAFGKYLSWVSTNDMTTFSLDERGYARGAISQCLCMNYTPALGSLRSYALNPTAIERSRVVDLAVKFGGVDGSSAAFIETLATNAVQYAYEDIKNAITIYCENLLAINTNDATSVAIRDRGVRLFYAKRLDWQNGSSLDSLFVGALSGYAFSSNRLDYANYVLSWTTNDNWRAMRNHFTSVTNELLSSGIPLVELSVPSPD